MVERLGPDAEGEDRGAGYVRMEPLFRSGEVAFEDAGALSTAATFSAVGEYELALTARQDDLSGTATLQVKVVPAAPERPLQAVETRAYRVDSPLWRDRVKALIVHWIPHCIRQIEDPDLREGGLNNFVEAAKKLTGQPAGEHRGYVFSNAWIFNTLEAICRALDVDADGDKEVIAAQTRMRATLEEWIPLVLAAQEPDGYLQTAFTLSERERWSPRYRGDHEGYVAGYFLDAPWRITGSRGAPTPGCLRLREDWRTAGMSISARRRNRIGSTAIRPWRWGS